MISVLKFSGIFLLYAMFSGCLIWIASYKVKIVFILPGVLLSGVFLASDFKILIIAIMFLTLVYSHRQKVGVIKLSVVGIIAVCSFLFFKNDASGIFSEGVTTNDFIHSALNCIDAKSLDTNKQLEFFTNEAFYTLSPLISALGLEDFRFSNQLLDLLKERHGFVNFETAAYNFGILAQFCYFDIEYWFAIILLTASFLAMSFWVVKIFHLDRMLMLGMYLIAILNLYRSGFGMFISFIALVLSCQIVVKLVYDVLPKRGRPQ